MLLKLMSLKKEEIEYIKNKLYVELTTNIIVIYNL